jgi:hypothetical protein
MSNVIPPAAGTVQYGSLDFHLSSPILAKNFTSLRHTDRSDNGTSQCRTRTVSVRRTYISSAFFASRAMAPVSARGCIIKIAVDVRRHRAEQSIADISSKPKFFLF